MAQRELHFHTDTAPRPDLPPRSSGPLTLGLLAMIAGQVLAFTDADGAVAGILSIVGLIALLMGIARLASNVDMLARRAAARDFEAAVKPSDARGSSS